MIVGVELRAVGADGESSDKVLLWRPLDRPRLSVGSNTECDLCVPHDAVAPFQFVLALRGSTLLLENKAFHGTQVGAELVEESVQLGDGDTIRLGDLVARICFRDEASEAEGPQGTRTLSTGMAKAAGQLYLTVPEALPGKEFPLSGAGLSIGADPSNDVVLADPYVSTFHARLYLEDGRCFVRDVGSRNGVFVGEQKVKEAEVPAGSQVRFGRIVGVVSSNLGAARPMGVGAGGGTRLVGHSRVVQDLRELLARVAQTEAPVLLYGETGTGKEVCARLVHELSSRAARAFIPINCGSLSPNLVESELFGHEKGAFTGATSRKDGAFTAAEHGTLFLDELGELPLALQPQFLRAVENGEIRRVGSTETQKVHVRLVAATNRVLEDEVRGGRFREDLYHRLNVLMVRLPPLRERREDIPDLARHFVALLAPSGARVELSRAATDKLSTHDWSGNIRELRNVIQRSVLLRRGDLIDADDIGITPRHLSDRVQAQVALQPATIATAERDQIIEELRRNRGSRKLAATALGISRATLYRRIGDLGIDLETID